MERSDATHVAVGSALFGISGVALSILIPLAVAAKSDPWGEPWFLAPSIISGVLGLAGLYMLAAVYTGWWLPTTASERVTRADLVDHGVEIIRRKDDFLVFQIGFENRGRLDIPKAVVNVTVPAFVASLGLCNLKGEALAGGTYSPTRASFFDEDEQDALFWNGYVDFPGRSSHPLYFRAILLEVRDVPIRWNVISVELPEEYERTAYLELSQSATT